jgi:hypothetical protein
MSSSVIDLSAGSADIDDAGPFRVVGPIKNPCVVSYGRLVDGHVLEVPSGAQDHLVTANIFVCRTHIERQFYAL